MSNKTKARNARRRKQMGTRSDRATRRDQLVSELLAKGVEKSIADKVKSPTIIGRGAYNFRKAFTGKNAAKKRGDLMKRAVDIGGRSLGALGQAAAGDYLGAMMSGLKILGKGDYALQRNTIVQDMTAGQVPVMHSSKESIRFRHREFVMDVVSPSDATAFNTLTFSLNPGLSNLFPFLSNIALNFQEYRFMGLAFEYKAMSGMSIASAGVLGMGTVALAAQYRANAPTFTNKVELMNQMWAVDGRPSDSFMLPIECAPAETPLDCLYIRGASVPDDVKFYDLAKITLAMTGIPVANSLIGELWVTYDVEMYKPQASGILDLYQPLYLGSITTSGANAVNIAQPFINASVYSNFDIRYLGTSVNSNSAVGNSYGFFHWDTSNSIPISTTAVGGASNSFAIGSRSLVLPFGLVGVFQLTLQYSGSAANTNLASGTDAFGNTVYGVSSTVQNNWKIVRSLNGSTANLNTICTFSMLFRIVSPSAQCIITMNAGNVFPSSITTTTMELIQVNGNAA